MGVFKVIGGVATAFFQNEEFWYKINGKDVTIILKEKGIKNPTEEEILEEYWKYENTPGEMEGGGKTTNNPDVYGRKCGGSPANPKICTK
tara:strand:+ start:1900 stop:2169 length:270 start_codon:yes stop_codon:yes gene_type:complete